jgi:hypothetical protein
VSPYKFVQHILSPTKATQYTKSVPTKAYKPTTTLVSIVDPTHVPTSVPHVPKNPKNQVIQHDPTSTPHVTQHLPHTSVQNSSNTHNYQSTPDHIFTSSNAKFDPPSENTDEGIFIETPNKTLSNPPSNIDLDEVLENCNEDQSASHSNEEDMVT